MSFIDIHDVGQLATLIGIPAVMIGIFMQIRSYKKEQREQAEKNRLAITTEINDKSQLLFERVEARLEAIKVASIITKEDITVLKTQINDLRAYVDGMDKAGTVEWQKAKPYLMARIEDLDKRCIELDSRFKFEMKEIAKEEIQKNKKVHEKEI